jgi:hypothetical protein
MAIGLTSAVALNVGLLSAGFVAPAQAHMTGGGGGSGMRGGGPGMMAMRSGPGAGPSLASHDFSRNMQMHTDRDHMDRDHDGDRDHDHDRFRHFRFFPSVAFGVGTYADDYDPYACWEVVRLRTHLGWRYRRVWVCD